MSALLIVAYGLPAPQGSKRHVGKGIMVESSKALKPWREAVKHAALTLVTRDGNTSTYSRPGAHKPLDGPLTVRAVFTFTRPRSHYRTGRNAHLLRDNAPARPQGTPDLSKLLRSTEDALTDAGIWVDDARVVEYERAAKVWAGEDDEALDIPGVRITIEAT